MGALLLVRISMLNKKGEERKTKMLCNLRDPRSRQKLWKCQKRPSHSVSPRRTPSLLKGKASKPARCRRPRPQMSTRSAPSVSPPEPKLRPQQSFPPQPGLAPPPIPPSAAPKACFPAPRRGGAWSRVRVPGAGCARLLLRICARLAVRHPPYRRPLVLRAACAPQVSETPALRTRPGKPP